MYWNELRIPSCATSLQRKSMLPGEGSEEVAHWPAFSELGLFQSATDSANALQQFVIVEEFLIRYGALNNNLGLAVDCQHGRFAGPFQLLDVIPRIPLEIAHGMDLFEVDHRTLSLPQQANPLSSILDYWSLRPHVSR